MMDDYCIDYLLSSANKQQIIGILLYSLQTKSHKETKDDQFRYLHVNPDRPYYYCHTALSKRIYTDRLKIHGKQYNILYNKTLYPALHQIIEETGFSGDIYMLLNDTKEIGIIFQPTVNSSVPPLALAERVSQTIQSIYEEHFPFGTGRYCNTTALSEPVMGVEGVREGYLQTEELKAASFFRMTPGVLTRERLEGLKNHATYRDVINLTRTLCQAVAQGEDAKGLALSKQLFLDMLKHSFDIQLVCDALSYLKQFLSIRLSVYLPQESFDLRALCSIASYITIEECFEALSPVLTTLCHTIKSTGAWSDSVVYAAYYLRNNIAKDVSLPEIAAFADTAPAYLSNQFHQQTGMTIKQYQQKIRMELACELLEKSNERISDIAGKTGFFDRRYFTKSFKDTFGTTPAQYRERHCVGQKDQNGTI